MSAAISRARSSLSQSSRYRLARYSLVSRYGPSVTTGAPSPRRTTFAFTASASPYAPSSSPVSRYFRLNASCRAIASGHSCAGNELHFSWLPYVSIRYFISGLRQVRAPAGAPSPLGRRRTVVLDIRTMDATIIAVLRTISLAVSRSVRAAFGQAHSDTVEEARGNCVVHECRC